jgi:hypothetical protein
MPAGFQIKVRNLETDETLIATLDSYEDALKFLADRPHLMEVITVLSDVSPVMMSEMKEAMRPYDEEEKAKLAGRASALVDALKKQREDEEARAKAEEERARAESKSLDPKRPQKVRWSLDDGFASNDPFDHRTVGAQAQARVTEWIKERNGWVADRGQIVAECEVEVYPEEIPEDEEAVLRGGKFTARLKDEPGN